MENNNVNQNTGAKGVFPGSNQASTPGGVNTQGTPPINHTGAQNTAPEYQQITNQEAAIVSNNPEGAKTYIKLETKNPDGQVSGVLSIDLISFREKGQESRYLLINAVGANHSGDESDTTMSIDNEADFNRFKKFVSELNWND